MDKDILMKPGDVFFINTGSCTVELINSILCLDGVCYVLDKNLILRV